MERFRIYSFFRAVCVIFLMQGCPCFPHFAVINFLMESPQAKNFFLE